MRTKRYSCMIEYPKLLRNIYYGMIQRCYNVNHKNYKNYGDKGIKIFDAWLKDHGDFYVWSMKNGYKEGLQIDRINPDLGYYPDNCRYITRQENIQSRKSITKLNPEMIRQIRKDFDSMTTRVVAKKWNICHRHIMDIKSKKAWSNVED